MLVKRKDLTRFSFSFGHQQSTLSLFLSSLFLLHSLFPFGLNVPSGYPGKLPKNYNAEVDPDPERWIPKRERTYYKGKRQKKGASVGRLPVACLSSERKEKIS